MIIAIYETTEQRAPDKIEFFFRERVQPVADIRRNAPPKVLPEILLVIFCFEEIILIVSIIFNTFIQTTGRKLVVETSCG